MKKFTLLLSMLTVVFALHAQQPEANLKSAKQDTNFCELYMSLNDADAATGKFNLYLNNQSVLTIYCGDRVIYKIYSTGKVTISDKNHKPFFDIQAKPGAKYYFEIDKGFWRRFFHLHNFTEEGDIESFMHFTFWNRMLNTSSGWHFDSGTKDYRKTVIKKEDPNHPICIQE
jgi:hypothetical protein